MSFGLKAQNASKSLESDREGKNISSSYVLDWRHQTAVAFMYHLQSLQYKIGNQNVFYYSDQTGQIAVITEPFCLPPMSSFDSLQGLLRMDDFHPAIMDIGSDGYLGFKSNSYGIAGMGFEVKYQCPVEEPCEYIKSTKFCKKGKEKGEM